MAKTLVGYAVLIASVTAGVCQAGADMPRAGAPAPKAVPEDCRRALRRTMEQVFQRRRDELKHYNPQRDLRTYQELVQDTRCPVSNKPYIVIDEAGKNDKTFHTIWLTCPDAKQHVAAQAEGSSEADYAVILGHEWRCGF